MKNQQNLETSNVAADPIEQFVDELLIQKAVVSPSLTAEALEGIRGDLIERVNQVVNMALVASLPKEIADEVVRLLETGDHDKAMDIIEEKSENTGAVVTTALANFRVQYLKGAR